MKKICKRLWWEFGDILILCSLMSFGLSMVVASVLLTIHGVYWLVGPLQ